MKRLSLPGDSLLFRHMHATGKNVRQTGDPDRPLSFARHLFQHGHYANRNDGISVISGHLLARKYPEAGTREMAEMVAEYAKRNFEAEYLVAAFPVSAVKHDNMCLYHDPQLSSEVGKAHVLISTAPETDPMKHPAFKEERKRITREWKIVYGTLPWETA